MEMDCWQYWAEVRSNVKKGTTGLFCLKCKYDFSKREITKRFGSMFEKCKCGGEVRLYHKELKKKKRKRK